MEYFLSFPSTSEMLPSLNTLESFGENLQVIPKKANEELENSLECLMPYIIEPMKSALCFGNDQVPVPVTASPKMQCHLLGNAESIKLNTSEDFIHRDKKYNAALHYKYNAAKINRDTKYNAALHLKAYADPLEENFENSELICELDHNLCVLSKKRREFLDFSVGTQVVNAFLDECGKPMYASNLDIINDEKDNLGIISVPEIFCERSNILMNQSDSYSIYNSSSISIKNALDDTEDVTATDSTNPASESHSDKANSPTQVIQISTSEFKAKLVNNYELEPSPRCIIIKDVNIFVCDLCQEEFISEREYIRHLKESNRGSRFCLIENRNENYRRTRSKKLKTPDGGSVATSLELLSEKESRILQSLQQRTLKCDLFGCSYRFSSSENRRKHQACHNFDPFSSLKFLCFQCNNKFSKWSACASHLWKDHGIDAGLLRCRICASFRTTSENLLAVHQQVHSDVKPFKCQVCDRCFKQRSQAINHEEVHKSLEKSSLSSWKQRTLCNICHRWYASYRSYLLHYKQIHEQLRIFSCSECGYRCNSKTRLTEHSRMHTQEKIYLCQICGFSCIDNNSLRRHWLRHLSVKHLACPAEGCPLMTAYASVFKYHMKTKHQLQDLSYGCRLCHFTSNQMEDYVRHCSGHEKELIAELFENFRKTKLPKETAVR